jgi:predicted metal-dependent hydrolase
MAMPVEVVRSRKRRKTVQAEVVDGRIRVHMPAWMSARQEQEYVTDLVERLEKRYRSEHVDLTARARLLARRHGFPEPAAITWSDRQRARWGSCSIGTREIRISRRLADWPSWVLDYVIVHELAHLVEPNHSPAFHALVARYPRAERAIGFLIAKGLGEDDDDVAPTDDEHGGTAPELTEPHDPDRSAGAAAGSGADRRAGWGLDPTDAPDEVQDGPRQLRLADAVLAAERPRVGVDRVLDSETD